MNLPPFEHQIHCFLQDVSLDINVICSLGQSMEKHIMHDGSISVLLIGEIDRIILNFNRYDQSASRMDVSPQLVNTHYAVVCFFYDFFLLLCKTFVSHNLKLQLS